MDPSDKKKWSTKRKVLVGVGGVVGVTLLACGIDAAVIAARSVRVTSANANLQSTAAVDSELTIEGLVGSSYTCNTYSVPTVDCDLQLNGQVLANVITDSNTDSRNKIDLKTQLVNFDYEAFRQAGIDLAQDWFAGNTDTQKVSLSCVANLKVDILGLIPISFPVSKDTEIEATPADFGELYDLLKPDSLPQTPEERKEALDNAVELFKQLFSNKMSVEFGTSMPGFDNLPWPLVVDSMTIGVPEVSYLVSTPEVEGQTWNLGLEAFVVELGTESSASFNIEANCEEVLHPNLYPHLYEYDHREGPKCKVMDFPAFQRMYSRITGAEFHVSASHSADHESFLSRLMGPEHFVTIDPATVTEPLRKATTESGAVVRKLLQVGAVADGWTDKVSDGPQHNVADLVDCFLVDANGFYRTTACVDTRADAGIFEVYLSVADSTDLALITLNGLVALSGPDDPNYAASMDAVIEVNEGPTIVYSFATTDTVGVGSGSFLLDIANVNSADIHVNAYSSWIADPIPGKYGEVLFEGIIAEDMNSSSSTDMNLQFDGGAWTLAGTLTKDDIYATDVATLSGAGTYDSPTWTDLNVVITEADISDDVSGELASLTGAFSLLGHVDGQPNPGRVEVVFSLLNATGVNSEQGADIGMDFANSTTGWYADTQGTAGGTPFGVRIAKAHENGPTPSELGAEVNIDTTQFFNVSVSTLNYVSGSNEQLMYAGKFAQRELLGATPLNFTADFGYDGYLGWDKFVHFNQYDESGEVDTAITGTLDFTDDDTNGFTGDFQFVDTRQTKELISTETPWTLVSGSYPCGVVDNCAVSGNPYTPGANCQWTLDRSGGYVTAADEFAIEGCCDALQIGNQFFAVEAPVSVPADSNTTIIFTSDFGGELSGFKLCWHPAVEVPTTTTVETFQLSATFVNDTYPAAGAFDLTASLSPVIDGVAGAVSFAASLGLDLEWTDTILRLNDRQDSYLALDETDPTQRFGLSISVDGSGLGSDDGAMLIDVEVSPEDIDASLTNVIVDIEWADDATEPVFNNYLMTGTVYMNNTAEISVIGATTASRQTLPSTPGLFKDTSLTIRSGEFMDVVFSLLDGSGTYLVDLFWDGFFPAGELDLDVTQLNVDDSIGLAIDLMMSRPITTQEVSLGWGVDVTDLIDGAGAKIFVGAQSLSFSTDWANPAVTVSSDLEIPGTFDQAVTAGVDCPDRPEACNMMFALSQSMYADPANTLATNSSFAVTVSYVHDRSAGDITGRFNLEEIQDTSQPLNSTTTVRADLDATEEFSDTGDQLLVAVGKIFTDDALQGQATFYMAASANIIDVLRPGWTVPIPVPTDDPTDEPTDEPTEPPEDGVSGARGLGYDSCTFVMTALVAVALLRSE